MELVNYPLVGSTIVFVTLWGAAYAGDLLYRRRPPLDIERDDIRTVLTTLMTLLALIIAFSFSMAAGRYDQRKNYEEAEANAIGTEYLRLGLLPAPATDAGRKLLVAYTAQRIRFYNARGAKEIADADAAVARLQTQLWDVVQNVARAHHDPVNALVAAGMNDVINSQGYTQAAFWYRIPKTAWWLMVALAVVGCFLFGYVAQRTERKARWEFTMALIVAVAFFLIGDLDSPRGGFITVAPVNLSALQLPP